MVTSPIHPMKLAMVPTLASRGLNGRPPKYVRDVVAMRRRPSYDWLIVSLSSMSSCILETEKKSTTNTEEKRVGVASIEESKINVANTEERKIGGYNTDEEKNQLNTGNGYSLYIKLNQS